MARVGRLPLVVGLDRNQFDRAVLRQPDLHKSWDICFWKVELGNRVFALDFFLDFIEVPNAQVAVGVRDALLETLGGDGNG